MLTDEDERRYRRNKACEKAASDLFMRYSAGTTMLGLIANGSLNPVETLMDWYPDIPDREMAEKLYEECKRIMGE